MDAGGLDLPMYGRDVPLKFIFSFKKEGNDEVTLVVQFMTRPFSQF